MFRLLLKLAIAGLIANAAWRLGSAYLTYYRFTDAVTESVHFAGSKSEAQLHSRVLELANQYDLPIDEDDFSIRRDDNHHTYVDGSYTQTVDFLPGYSYAWPFTWKIDVFVVDEKAP